MVVHIGFIFSILSILANQYAQASTMQKTNFWSCIRSDKSEHRSSTIFRMFCCNVSGQCSFISTHIGSVSTFQGGHCVCGFLTGSGRKQSAFDLLFIFPTVKIVCPEARATRASIFLGALKNIVHKNIAWRSGKKLEATPKLPDSYGWGSTVAIEIYICILLWWETWWTPLVKKYTLW